MPVPFFLLALLLHPVGSPTHNHVYVKCTLLPDRVRLSATLLIGELPAVDERARMDKNGDGSIEEPEAKSYADEMAQRIAAGLSLVVDGKATTVFGPPELGLGANRARGPFPFSLDRAATVEVQGQPRHEVVIRESIGLGRVAEVEVALEEAPGVRIERNEPRPSARPSHSGGLGWVWPDPGTGAREVQLTYAVDPSAAGSGAVGRPSLRRPSELLGARGAAVLPALGFALLLGILHALLPGHGKAMIASYLVGDRGTVQSALLVGLGATAAHLAVVLVLGGGLLLLSAQWLEAAAASWLPLLAGGFAILLGTWRMVRGEKEHRHGTPSRGAMGLGMVSGLLPCDAGLAVLIAAAAFGRIGFGLALLLAFAVGVAVVLMSVALAAAFARAQVERLLGSAWASRMPRLSGLATIVFGVVVVVLASGG